MRNLKTDVLIIGAGPAGLTAAIYASRAGVRTHVLEGRAASRLAIGYDIENFPGFLTIPSRELLERFRNHARHFGAEILSGDAIALGLDSDPKFVTTKDVTIEARAVVIATGKPLPKEMMIPGEERLTGQGVSYCATCDGPLFRGAEVAALGGTEEALEDVLALNQMGCRVHWILGAKKPEMTPLALEKAEKAGVRIHPDRRIREIIGQERVEKIFLAGKEGDEELVVSGVFIFREIPTAPLFSRAGILLDHRQCISVDRFQRTSLPGVFAAGDVTCGGLQIVAACGEGCVAAMQALLDLRKAG